MFDRDEQENPQQPKVEVLSATRPPQLNKTICGCRCGRGSGGVSREGVGGDSDDDAGTTLVGSDGSESGASYPASSEVETRHARLQAFFSPTPNQGIDEFRARIGLLFADSDTGLGQHVMDSPYRMGFPQEYDDMANSMGNEPGSDIHSVVPLDSRSVRCMSPGPGIGQWTEDYPLGYQYHFLARPLRLTPQHRYCRGLVASHLVLQDEATFIGTADGEEQ